MQDYEKLGAFYLGRLHDLAAKTDTKELLLYDAKDLTTHGVVVGMTGSGKTGLGVTLLEEAAIDGIPALVIDPKGDMGNLMLNFPALKPSDFRPWVDSGEASRKGFTTDEYAKHMAGVWRKGLASWGQKPERLARLRDAAEVAIYTPGSSAGLPLTVLRSFAAPPPVVVQDADAMRDRVMAAVSGLLALLGIDADPIRSREHILLSNLLDRAWREGRDLEVGTLIGEIQSPPFDKLGFFDLETFFPAKDRLGLAMSLNNLLASPGFAAWMEGEPLEIQRLLYTPEGRPRISILSIAHLSEAERMFFVTVLLNEVVAWMRTQSGTSSLRALLYMDEVFGYFPPTAEPPSKRPMLTLLKQARAYGLGVLLATQNPVDLDYKGLSNTGSWFIGRLQTERDKARVLEGLEGASATAGHGFDRSAMEATIAGLGSRVFLMHNVHEDQPALFRTRWAMSYLRGPMTREHIQTLMDPLRQAAAVAAPAQSGAVTRPEAGEAPKAAPQKPVVPSDVPQFFLAQTEAPGRGKKLVYRPALLAAGRLHYVSARRGVDEWRELAMLAPFGDLATDEVLWSETTGLGSEEPELKKKGEAKARFAELPTAATRAKSYSQWEKAFKAYLYREHTLGLWYCKSLKEVSRPEESEGEFRIRLTQAAHEKRDLELGKLRKRYAPKLRRLQVKIGKAEQRLEKEQSQYGHQKMQTAISMGATLLGALFGRKLGSSRSVGRATTALRGAGRAAREKDDIGRAREQVKELKQNLQELEEEFAEVLEDKREALDVSRLELEELAVRARKSDTSVTRLALAWTPWRVTREGIAEPLFGGDE